MLFFGLFSLERTLGQYHNLGETEDAQYQQDKVLNWGSTSESEKELVPITVVFQWLAFDWLDRRGILSLPIF